MNKQQLLERIENLTDILSDMESEIYNISVLMMEHEENIYNTLDELCNLKNDINKMEV